MTQMMRSSIDMLLRIASEDGGDDHHYNKNQPRRQLMQCDEICSKQVEVDDSFYQSDAPAEDEETMSSSSTMSIDRINMLENMSSQITITRTPPPSSTDEPKRFDTTDISSAKMYCHTLLVDEKDDNVESILLSESKHTSESTTEAIVSSLCSLSTPDLPMQQQQSSTRHHDAALIELMKMSQPNSISSRLRRRKTRQDKGSDMQSLDNVTTSEIAPASLVVADNNTSKKSAVVEYPWSTEDDQFISGLVRSKQLVVQGCNLYHPSMRLKCYCLDEVHNECGLVCKCEQNHQQQQHQPKKNDSSVDISTSTSTLCHGLRYRGMYGKPLRGYAYFGILDATRIDQSSKTSPMRLLRMNDANESLSKLAALSSHFRKTTYSSMIMAGARDNLDSLSWVSSVVASSKPMECPFTLSSCLFSLPMEVSNESHSPFSSAPQQLYGSSSSSPIEEIHSGRDSSSVDNSYAFMSALSSPSSSTTNPKVLTASSSQYCSQCQDNGLVSFHDGGAMSSSSMVRLFCALSDNSCVSNKNSLVYSSISVQNVFTSASSNTNITDRGASCSHHHPSSSSSSTSSSLPFSFEQLQLLHSQTSVLDHHQRMRYFRERNRRLKTQSTTLLSSPIITPSPELTMTAKQIILWKLSQKFGTLIIPLFNASVVKTRSRYLKAHCTNYSMFEPNANSFCCTSCYTDSILDESCMSPTGKYLTTLPSIGRESPTAWVATLMISKNFSQCFLGYYDVVSSSLTPLTTYLEISSYACPCEDHCHDSVFFVGRQLDCHSFPRESVALYIDSMAHPENAIIEKYTNGVSSKMGCYIGTIGDYYYALRHAFNEEVALSKNQQTQNK